MKYLKFFLIAFAVITIAASSINPPTESETFQNLKVLPKDITEHQLDSVMDHFKASLGVKCSFCHADGPVIDGKKHLDFVSDTKPEKLRAREMLLMTSYINENFFNPDHSERPDTLHGVICFTCHRGNREPESGPMFQQVDSILKVQHH